MPCGFDVESLVDFETALTSTSAAFQSGGHCDDWTAISDFDSEALALIKDTQLDSNKSCGSSQRSTNQNSMTSPSSYCRRLGSASGASGLSGRGRGSSLSFQLWSPRLRLRDERKRVLKLSLAKLRRIEDPESCLRRSVLLNNTLRRLQRESRDEKLAASGAQIPALPTLPALPDCTVTENAEACPLPVDSAADAPRSAIKRRRPSSDSGDEDTAECLPVRSEEDESPKRAKTNTPPSSGGAASAAQRPALRPCNSMAPSSGFSGLVSGSAGFDVDKQFGSCGQSSLLFGELQSVVFHSLITSLES